VLLLLLLLLPLGRARLRVDGNVVGCTRTILKMED
jgi:hypothetical protein